MAVALQLLGSPRVSSLGRWRELSLTRPTMLLFYLAYYGEWTSREELAFFFRPDADAAIARHFVRKMLSGARQLAFAEGLEVEPERLRWRADTDVARLRQAVREGQWGKAFGLYRGKLLASLNADNAPSFAAWLELEREALSHVWHEAGLRYAGELEAAGQYSQAAGVTARLLEDNPLAEEALKTFMRAAYLGGQRERALHAFETFRVELATELALLPLEATRQLAAQIYAGEVVAATHTAVPDSVSLTATLMGTERELRELLELLGDPDSRLITLADTDDIGREALIIARRIPDTQLALMAIVALAERLIGEGHFERALELLALTLSHASCDARVRRRAEPLWLSLETHFPRARLDRARRPPREVASLTDASPNSLEARPLPIAVRGLPR